LFSFRSLRYHAPITQLTHRPAFPHQPDSHADYRIVIYYGVIVGSISHETTAYRGRVWRWSTMSEVNHSKGGEAQSLEEALPLIKAAVVESMERWPDLLEKDQEHQKRGRDSFNHWARIHGKPEREI